MSHTPVYGGFRGSGVGPPLGAGTRRRGRGRTDRVPSAPVLPALKDGPTPLRGKPRKRGSKTGGLRLLHGPHPPALLRCSAARALSPCFSYSSASASWAGP